MKNLWQTYKLIVIFLLISFLAFESNQHQKKLKRFKFLRIN